MIVLNHIAIAILLVLVQIHTSLVLVSVHHASLVLRRLRQRKAGQEAVACASSHQTASLAVASKSGAMHEAL